VIRHTNPAFARTHSTHFVRSGRAAAATEADTVVETVGALVAHVGDTVVVETEADIADADNRPRSS